MSVISLRELQRRFVSAVLWEHDGILMDEIVPSGIDPARRLQIYRNNVREGFLGALEAAFPVVARLGGADWFKAAAWHYQRQQPSHSGNLHHIGEQFAGYLAREFAGSRYEYFADVARLEWAYQEVLIAIESAPCDFSRLQTITSEDHVHLRLRVAPTLRWVRSRFPLLAIWQANQTDAKPTSVDLGAGPANVLVARRHDHIELRECSDTDCALLQAFADDLTLDAAAQRLSRTIPDADFVATLVGLAGSGFIADWVVDA